MWETTLLWFLLGLVVGHIAYHAGWSMRVPKILRRTPPLAHYVRLYRYEVWQDLGIPTNTFAITPQRITSGTITASRIAAGAIMFGTKEGGR